MMPGLIARRDSDQVRQASLDLLAEVGLITALCTDPASCPAANNSACMRVH
jgi:hypothetical protein